MKNSKVCIIDDNQAVCDSLAFLVSSFYGIKVKTYNNPLVFLDEFSADWFGCLIIDLFMPTINGIELMRQLKKRNSNLEVIIISGHATSDIAQQCLAKGAHAFISKPFKTEELLEKIQAILSKDSAELFA